MTALVVAAALLGAYNAAAAWTYSSAKSAHERFECAAAKSKYGQVAGFYSLAFTVSKERARAAEQECTWVLDAEKLAKDGEHKEAVSAYANAIEANPASPLKDELERRRTNQTLAWSDELVERGFDSQDGKYLVTAMNNYMELDEENRSARAAAGIEGIDNRVARSTEREPCIGLRYASALDDAYSRYRDELARALYGCAGEKFAARRFAQAQKLYDRFIREVPRHKLVPAAKRRSIAAEVASIRGKGTGSLPAPVASGSSGSSAVELRIQNSSPYGLEYLVSGPDARRITLPACRGCTKYSLGQEPTGCPPGGPSRTIRVRAGSYTEVVRSLSGDVTDYSGDQRFSSGTSYSHCFFIVTSPG